MKLPEKTVERLSGYRRTLFNCLANGKSYIYSHELAELHNITAVQVRRDIMFIGYSSAQKKGYDVKELIQVIGKILDTEEGRNVAIVGLGHLGTAITDYFLGKRPKLKIVAAFDINPNKTNKTTSGIFCYHMDQLQEIINSLQISIAILTIPPEKATAVSGQLIHAGIKGILNFTSAPLQVPADIWLEQYDMVTSLEKVAYFVKNRNDIETED